MPYLARLWIFLVGGFLPAPWSTFQTSHDERLLGPPPPGTTLVDRFRHNMLTPVEVEQVNLLLRQLAQDDFRVREKAFRELQYWRPGAEVILRRHRDGTDLERDRRISRILQQGLGRWSPTQAEAAARSLKRSPTAETARVLLEYLPFADDHGVTLEIASTLKACAAHDRDETAAVIATASLDPSLRSLVERSLDPKTDEPSPTIQAVDLARRFFGLVAGGDPLGVVEVIQLPFALGNGMILNTASERDDFFRQAVATYRTANMNATLTFMQASRGEDYFRFVPFEDADILRNVPNHEIRAVHVRMRRDWNHEEVGAVLVRISPSGNRVIGLGHLGPRPIRGK